MIFDLSTLPPLARGSHKSPEDGMCVMEAVTYVTGEAFGDHPACVCPVIGTFLRSWNDSLPDAERETMLKPLIFHIIGTRADDATQHRRRLMAADWLLREYTSTWLRLAGLTDDADALASLPEITDFNQCPSLMPFSHWANKSAAAASNTAWRAVGNAAENAAWRAASNAAGNAAKNAACSAARNTNWSAAGNAAENAAWRAASNAARDAARDADSNAAWNALAPTVAALQQSAIRLVHRMIAPIGLRLVSSRP